jgi:outer membrane protein insertion porin family
MRKQLLVVLAFLLSLVAFGSEAVYEVKEIEVTKNREVPVEVIKSVLESKVGEGYSTETMVEDYKRVKNLEYIDDVVIYPRLYSGGIKLNVEVKEAKNVKELLEAKGIIPLSERETVDKSLIVSAIEIFGNRYVSREDIMKEIPVQVGAYFSRTKVLEGQKNILNTGFFRDVNPEVYRYGDGVLVRYTLMENPVITGVKIHGNTVYSNEELMEEIKTVPGEIYNINT